MQYRIIIYLLLMTLTISMNLLAQDGPRWRFPDSPTGNAAKAILTAIDSGDEATIGAFVDNHLAQDILTQVPREEIIGMLRSFHADFGKFEVPDVRKTDPHSVALTIATESGERMIISFKVSDQPPHRISDIGVDEAAAAKKNFTSIDELKQYLEKEAAANRFSGVVLLAKEGKPFFQQAYGMADKRFDVPNKVDTKFNIGSINKEFTALAIAQLAAAGKINLQDKISKYLPDFPKEKADKITVSHLMHHQSGLGHYWQAGQELGWRNLRTLQSLFEVAKDQELAFEPGTSQRYSNSGYVVLGAIIEAVSGQSYDDYVQEHIFQPAGMTHTVAYEADHVVKNLATGYTNQSPEGSAGEGYQYNNFFTHSIKGSPAGGGYSTAQDLLKYDIAKKSGRLLLKKPEGADRVSSNGGGLGIAGGSFGINAILESDWELGYTVVVLSNYDPPTGEELGLEIMTLLRDKQPMSSR